MKRMTSLLLCVVLLTAILLPVTAMANAASMFVYTANKGPLNMRSSMVTGANNLVIQIPYGAEVNVTSFVNETWAKVQYNDKTGYVMQRYLTDTKPANVPSSNTGDDTLSNSMFSGMTTCYYSATVRPAHPTGFVNLRWAPSTGARIHDKYYAGATLIVMAENSSWCQVLDAENNVMGFMMKSFLVAQ